MSRVSNYSLKGTASLDQIWLKVGWAIIGMSIGMVANSTFLDFILFPYMLVLIGGH
jgi:hypothetical protein